MAQLTPQILQEAMRLIEQLRSSVLNDDQIADVVTRLDKILPDPNYLAYTIDRVPQLSAEEVVRKAFLYKPIQL
jgi:predicted extracellular nuclease